MTIKQTIRCVLPPLPILLGTTFTPVQLCLPFTHRQPWALRRPSDSQGLSVYGTQFSG